MVNLQKLGAAATTATAKIKNKANKNTKMTTFLVIFFIVFGLTIWSSFWLRSASKDDNGDPTLTLSTTWIIIGILTIHLNGIGLCWVWRRRQA